MSSLTRLLSRNKWVSLKEQVGTVRAKLNQRRCKNVH